MESFLHYLQTLNPLLIYAVLFLIAFLENIFPPSPSDMVVVFGGSLAGLGIIGFLPALLWSTAGSVAGFLTMFKVGEWFGAHIIERYRPKFLPLEAIHKVEGWFARYGYAIIIANRFLAGTRAVVSFFAGMSELKTIRTTLLSAVSALAWNAVLVGGGYALGQNWTAIGFYLSAYSQFVTGLVVLAAIVWGIRTLVLRRRRKEEP